MSSKKFAPTAARTRQVLRSQGFGWKDLQDNSENSGSDKVNVLRYRKKNGLSPKENRKMNKPKFALLAPALWLALTLPLSCSINDANIIAYGNPIAYEGEYYQTVVIGAQTYAFAA
jgi:hypothetical protein